MTVKFSIFASKPPIHSLSRHYHEFRHVHAIQTIEASQPAGIMSYTQGFVPFAERFFEETLRTSQGPSLVHLLPLPRLHEADATVPPVTIMTRLEFINYQAVNGTFKSPQYQATSGAHHFAVPQVIYITEELESLADQAKALGFNVASPYARKGLARTRLVVAVAPTGSEFKAKWDAHAKLVHAAIAEFVKSSEALPLSYLPLVEYQRHQSINLSQSQLDSVLDGSQFRDAKFRLTSGGYEEFAFLHTEVQIAFLKKYGDKLRASYESFGKVGHSANSSELSSFAVVCDEARLR
jgi:hypothetical protein